MHTDKIFLSKYNCFEQNVLKMSKTINCYKIEALLKSSIEQIKKTKETTEALVKLEAALKLIQHETGSKYLST